MRFVPVGPAPVKLRLLAFAIDAALVATLAVAVGLTVTWWLAAVVALAGIPVLAAVLLAAFGTTLGKRAVGIHVVAGDGGRPRLGAVLRRELWGRLVLEHALLLAGGAGAVGYGAGLRGGPPWHDAVSGTRVVGRVVPPRRSLAPEFVPDARVGPGGLELGRYLPRVAAYLLDYGLVTTVWAAFFVPIAAFTDQIQTHGGDSVTFSGPFVAGALISLLVASGVYPAVAIHLFETTVGKHAAGLAVRRSDGSRVEFWRALWRELGAGTLVLTVIGGSITFGLVPVLDYLFPIWDPRSQALHDKMADTVVVTAGPRRRPRLDTTVAATDTDV
jgi:uncharacterized RDD family membrane protein YckC